ncbi:hypothetical protein, partial [Selenomonas sp.]|uniref:hypothetical protein n=1 Tax=Selenomonas sp. TaxID=2053611 RepID=UPI003FA28F9C
DVAVADKKYLLHGKSPLPIVALCHGCWTFRIIAGRLNSHGFHRYNCIEKNAAFQAIQRIAFSLIRKRKEMNLCQI